MASLHDLIQRIADKSHHPSTEPLSQGELRHTLVPPKPVCQR